MTEEFVKHYNYQEVEAVIAEGDLDLRRYREAFQTAFDMPTSLADPLLINIAASYEVDGELPDEVIAGIMYICETYPDYCINPGTATHDQRDRFIASAAKKHEEEMKAMVDEVQTLAVRDDNTN